jgi:hypothetical protein
MHEWLSDRGRGVCGRESLFACCLLMYFKGRGKDDHEEEDDADADDAEFG